MTKKEASNEKSSILSKFKQAGSPSFGTMANNFMANSNTQNKNLLLSDLLESTHKHQKENFSTAAQTVSSLGKMSPEASIEAMRTIERMHHSVLNAQCKESKETRKCLMFTLAAATVASLGGAALYATRRVNLYGTLAEPLPLNSHLPTKKVTKPKI